MLALIGQQGYSNPIRPVTVGGRVSSEGLIKLLKGKGWELKRIKGSHHIFAHPDFDYPVIVPHPKKDLGIGLVRKIMNKARL